MTDENLTPEERIAQLEEKVAALEAGLSHDSNARPFSAPEIRFASWFSRNPIANKSQLFTGTAGLNSIEIVEVAAGGPAIQATGLSATIPLYLRPKGASAVILGDLTGQHVIIGDSGSPTGKVRMPLDEFISWEGSTPGSGIDGIRVEDKAGRDTLILGSTGVDDTWVSAITAVYLNAPTLGFYGTSGTTKPTITGAHGSNAALQSLLTALAAFGLIVDGSS